MIHSAGTERVGPRLGPKLLSFSLSVVFALTVLNGSAAAQWTPPPGGGDDALNGLTTDPSLSTNQQSTFSDAMGIVGATNPDIANEINGALANGSVGVADIQNEGDLSAFQHGAADGNTLGLELDYKSPSEVAGTIVHEWQHIRGRNQDPGYLSQEEECREAAAYSSQATALCVAQCEFNLDIGCDEWNRVKAGAACMAESCRAQGGSPPPVPSCPCSPLGC